MELFNKIKTSELKLILKKIKKSEPTRQDMIHTLIENLNLFSINDIKLIAKQMELNYSGNKNEIIERIKKELPFTLKAKIFIQEKVKNVDKKKLGMVGLGLTVFLLGIYKKDTLLQLSDISLKSLLNKRKDTILKELVENDNSIDYLKKQQIAKIILKNRDFKKKIDSLIDKFSLLKLH